MLRRFGDAAETLLRDLLPAYAPALERARTSFRPAEIAGRDYSPRHDDRLLHVDAFPSRPMRGQSHPAPVQQHRPGRRLPRLAGR